MLRANLADVQRHGFDLLDHCADVWKPPYDKPEVELDDDVLHKYIITFVRTFMDEKTADLMDKTYHNHKDNEGEKNHGSN